MNCSIFFWVLQPIGSMVLPYMVTWIPSIYPLYVSIYTSTMDPSWVMDLYSFWSGFMGPIFCQVLGDFVPLKHCCDTKNVLNWVVIVHIFSTHLNLCMVKWPCNMLHMAFLTAKSESQKQFFIHRLPRFPKASPFGTPKNHLLVGGWPTPLRNTTIWLWLT